MIDLERAYHDVDAMLAEEGYGHAAYSIDLTIWNHRHDGAEIRFTISAQHDGLPGCLMAFEWPTFARALDDLREQIRALHHRADGTTLADLRETRLPAGAVVSDATRSIPDPGRTTL